MCRGEDPRVHMRQLWLDLGVPVVAIAVFLFVWSQVSSRHPDQPRADSRARPRCGSRPKALWADHLRASARRPRRSTSARRSATPRSSPRIRTRRSRRRKYTGKPTYIDQIFTSLKTVFAGFLLATLVAVPLGILCGLSKTVNAALNPLIQVFKPVSPLAWLPIVTMVVSAVYVTADPMFEKSFLNSAITVTLCSLWPTVINTALGVASIDRTC